MKTLKLTLLPLFFLGVISKNIQSQESIKSENPFSIRVDLTSSYVWRGTKFSGPAFQPCLEYKIGNFNIGSWGSFGFSDQIAEADLYLSYEFDFGLTLGATDYYYQGSPYFRYNTDSASHAFEINTSYEINNFSISVNYILNNASKGGPANKGGDMYFELAYIFNHFNIFAGAGNGWHTIENPGESDEFMVCNLGISTEKELKISDTFSLPVSGAVIINPQSETFNIVMAVSF